MGEEEHVPVLLVDNPSDKDEIGTLDTIANAIHETIRTNMDRAHSIALIGRWGTGKSTVVKLLELKYNSDDSDTSCFIFDAWSHEGDPLRRAFVEKAYTYLERENLIPPARRKYWKHEVEQFTKRVTTTSMTNTPKLTVSGGLILAFMLLVPLGTTLLGGWLDSGNSDSWTWLGFVLSTLPFVTIVLALIVYSFRWLERGDDDTCQNSNPLLFLIKQTIEQSSSTAVDTRDPTSIEFQRTFSNLLSEVLHNNDRKLLIVVDNLDRMGVDDALHVWSTMRAFFESESKELEEWRGRVCLLVPFDEYGVSKIWSQVPDKSDDDTPLKALEGKKQDSQSLARRFIEKTFQVVMHVPEPVLSDLRSYMNKKTQEAFPWLPSGVHHKLYRIFEVVIGDKSPRRVKMYVNYLAILMMRWGTGGKQIPVECLALYSALWNSKQEIQKLLSLENSYFSGLYARISNPRWRLYITAIHFNVAPEKAQGVFIGPRIQNFVQAEDGDSDLYASMSRIPGFWEELDSIIEHQGEDWAKETPQYLARLSSHAGKAKEDISEAEKSARLRLAHELASVKRWDLPGTTTGEAIGAALDSYDLFTQEEYHNLGINLLRAYSRSGYTEPNEEEEGEGNPNYEWISGWVDGAEQFYMKALEYAPEALDTGLSTPGDAHAYHLIANTALNRDALGPTTEHLKPSTNVKDVASYYAKHALEGPWTEQYFKSLSQLSHNGYALEYESIATPVANRLRKNGVRAPEAIHCLRTLYALTSNENISTQHLQELCNDAFPYHFLHDAVSRKQYPAAAGFLACILEYRPVGGVPKQILTSHDGYNNYNELLSKPDAHPELRKALSKFIYSELDLSHLLAKIGTHKQLHPLLAFIIEDLVSENGFGKVFSVEQAVEHYPLISLSDTSKNGLWATYGNNEEMRNTVLSQTLDNPSTSVMHLHMLQHTDLHAAEITRTGEKLKAVSEAQWGDEIRTRGYLMQLALLMNERDGSFTLGVGYLNSVESALKKWLSGTAVENVGDHLIPLLTTSDKNTLEKRIAKLLPDATANVVAVDEILGSSFASTVVNTCDLKSLVIHLFHNIIGQIAPPEWAWMERVVGLAPMKFKDIGKDDYNRFVEELKEAVTGRQHDEVVETAKRILESLNEPVPNNEDHDA